MHIVTGHSLLHFLLSTLIAKMEKEKLSGPYRATKLWNEAILTFREGMPLKKHRRHMRLHDECFTGNEAVTWLHRALQKNPNFDTVVTREQIIQLLQKFFRAAIFEKIGDKGSDTLDQFKDNNNIYKFCSRSPLRDMQLPNLLDRNPGLKKPAILKLDSSPKMVRVPEISSSLERKRFLDEVKNKAINKQRSQLEVGEVWKSVILGRLEALMEGVNIEQLVPPDEVNGYWIAENAENGKGHHETLARQLEGVRGLPNWIVSAMKTVMNWPQQAQQGALTQSGYAGFEKDVFKEVEKYFNDCESPLISTTFSNAFCHAFMYAEFSASLSSEEDSVSEDEETQINPDAVYPLSSKSVENLVLGMSSPVRPVTNPFVQHDVTLYQELQVNSTNPFAEFIRNPISQSLNEQPTVSDNRHVHSHCQSMYQYQAYESDQVVSGSKILTTVLPPNSCFETAFTSESPTTRIIPQRTVDTIHFQRRQRARQSQRELEFHTPTSPVYVRMDQFRKNKPAHSKTKMKNEPKLVKKNNSDGSFYSFQSALAYELSPPSEMSGECSSGAHLSGACSSGSLLSAERSSGGHLSGEHTLGSGLSGGGDHVSRRHASRYQMVEGDCYSATSARDARNKHHSLNTTIIQRSQSVPPVPLSPFAKRNTENCPALPPKPPKSDQKVNVIYENLQDMKNQSGGYVNLALSYDDANYNGNLLDNAIVQELDVDSAMKSLFSLMKCSQSTQHVAHSTPAHDFDTPLPPRLSLSSIGSCQTSAAENTPTPRQNFIKHRATLQMPADFPVVNSVQGKKIAIEVMQLLLLVIPPQNRKKLSLLISFIAAVGKNTKLNLSEHESNLCFLVGAFKNCLLSLAKDEACGGEEWDNDQELKYRLLKFMVFEADQVFEVPADLYDEVQQHITEFEQEQIKGSQHLQRQQQWRQHRLESRQQPRSYEDCKATEVSLRTNVSQPAITFCEQVTHQQFEQQKFTGSQRALYELLEQIINDPKMALKEKQKRLEMFKHSYPHIYEKRFPNKEEEDKVLAPKPKGLLRFASLSRLKNLRL